MIELRNSSTGVVVRVDADLAACLGAEWVAADEAVTVKRGRKVKQDGSGD